ITITVTVAIHVSVVNNFAGEISNDNSSADRTHHRHDFKRKFGKPGVSRIRINRDTQTSIIDHARRSVSRVAVGNGRQVCSGSGPLKRSIGQLPSHSEVVGTYALLVQSLDVIAMARLKPYGL